MDEPEASTDAVNRRWPGRRIVLVVGLVVAGALVLGAGIVYFPLLALFYGEPPHVANVRVENQTDVALTIMGQYPTGDPEHPKIVHVRVAEVAPGTTGYLGVRCDLQVLTAKSQREVVARHEPTGLCDQIVTWTVVPDSA